jgi:acetyl/propionyl-CoA carboxylase alpha subunit
MAPQWKSQVPQTAWSFSVRPGGWIIAEQTSDTGQVIRKRIMVSENRAKISFRVDGILWNGELSHGRDRGTASKADLESALTVQFPGKVRKILVGVGEAVVQGQKLVLVEAMKMEFSVMAPKDGKILSILVKEGQQISPGDRFVEME